MASDLHTHRNTALRALFSSPVVLDRIFSLEYHPWYIVENDGSLPPDFERNARSAAAIGECGLDRLKGASLPTQITVFEKICDVAEKQDKTLIVHCVRCESELLQVLKNFKLDRVLIHGFNRSVSALDKLVQKGFMISLAPYFWRKPGVSDALRQMDFDRIGFESDDCPDDFEKIFQDAQQVLQIDDLAEKSDRLFDHIVANPKKES